MPYAAEGRLSQHYRPTGWPSGKATGECAKCAGPLVLCGGGQRQAQKNWQGPGHKLAAREPDEEHEACEQQGGGEHAPTCATHEPETALKSRRLGFLLYLLCSSDLVI